ncbi:MAG: 3-hydroxyacyl-CoA dehydrogenase [Alteromonadaceae bacterium]|nr:3-hydroxyacyl-CoA dehydrogenase [Alteromonadaceae bacterium]RPH12342.1 MAG: 3-hydroxyacyl-CoA dehydrogenase [Alteromonadaceae bacterium TMED101]
MTDSNSNTDVASYLQSSAQKAWQIDGISDDLPLRTIERVGIIGAGTMGGGISMNFASVGLPVTIVETKQEALDRGLATIRKNYQRSADRGRFPQEEVDICMGCYAPALDLGALADCDLIIEAVFEDMDIKKSVFKQLDQIAKPGAILATNTSALDIDEIASITSRPQDVIGLHFFSPANVMRLLEIVRAEETADDVVATSVNLARQIGKIATLVGVCPGFVGNRILFARQYQANALVYEGVMPWDVDAAFNAFGFKMGPFQMADLAGLDIGWKKGAKTTNPIRDALCELDRRGQKTGAGYYDYDESRKNIPSDVTAKIIREITGAGDSTLSSDAIIDRCVIPMINEALAILEENKAQRPSDIDVVWINGYGWPLDKGGVLYYADTIGAEKVLSVMIELAASDNSIKVSPLLRELAASGGRFVDIDTGGLKV